VLGNLQNLFYCLSFFLFILTILLFVLYVIRAEDSDCELIIKRPNAVVKTALAFFLSGVISCCLPSQTTMYAIAASQMGEQALKTPLAGKAGKALEAWLDKQINENGGDKK
jgi:hypothetical protein